MFEFNFIEQLSSLISLCCPFGPSRKILTDNGTEFKNKLWTEVFDKFKTEQKFTPIYSPQCNGRVEGFHKFSQTDRELCQMGRSSMESHSSIQLLPNRIIRNGTILPHVWTGSCSETYPTTIRKPKISRNRQWHDQCGINDQTLHGYCTQPKPNQARKARDGNKKGRTMIEPEKLKIGDNILVRDHTSKAFQPKYKDFCIIGLLGKNQVEVKDNHGHTTKVHGRDIKKIPMTEKVCQLYEEEQIRKVREGRKAVPNNKMPELGWDIAETQLQMEGEEQTGYQESKQTDSQQTPRPLQAMIAIAIIIKTILEHIRIYIQEIPIVARKTTQALKSTATKTNRSRFMKNIRKSYRTAMLAITIVTSMTNRTSCISQQQTNNNNKQNTLGT